MNPLRLVNFKRKRYALYWFGAGNWQTIFILSYATFSCSIDISVGLLKSASQKLPSCFDLCGIPFFSRLIGQFYLFSPSPSLKWLYKGGSNSKSALKYGQVIVGSEEKICFSLVRVAGPPCSITKQRTLRLLRDNLRLPLSLANIAAHIYNLANLRIRKFLHCLRRSMMQNAFNCTLT